MISDFTQQIYNSAVNDSFFDNFGLMLENDFRQLKFPVRDNIISFGTEKNDRLNFLLGYDIFESGEEKTIVTVLTDEKSGGAYCEQCARDICMKILELDTDKMINSVAVERCVYDPNAFAYKVRMAFGLREIAVDV